MAEIKLTYHEPFIVKAKGGEYAIPPLEDLEYEDWQIFEKFDNENLTVKETIDTYKEFFTKICPGLANEKIADNQWGRIGSAYLEEMGE